MASDVFHDRSAGALARLGSPKTVLLETRRRDGTWVPTPVSLVIDAGRAYFRTYDASGKYKRLRNFPQVRLARCTFRGRPLGPAVDARAVRLGSAGAEHARSLLAARFPVLHGKIVPWVHRRKGWSTVHYELIFGS